MSKTTSKQKPKKPKALTVYFGDDKVSFANEIERIADDFHLSVSELCTMMLFAGFSKTTAKLLHEKNEREKLITQQRAESIK